MLTGMGMDRCNLDLARAQAARIEGVYAEIRNKH
jgi:hypothetical protein